MDTQALAGYIRQGIRKEVFDDRIELYLPFIFSADQTDTVCLVWDRTGCLSDRGQTMAALKKRLGDLTPYQNPIQTILKRNDLVTLEGGQNLTVRHFQTCIRGSETYLDYLGGLNRLLRVMSLISIVDRVQVTEEGTVIPC